MAALDHDEVSEMLAIYSLDAFAYEAALVEQHLADCPRCQADLASLREKWPVCWRGRPPARPKSCGTASPPS